MATKQALHSLMATIKEARKAIAVKDNKIHLYLYEVLDIDAIDGYIDSAPNPASKNARKLVIKRVIQQHINQILDEKFGKDQPIIDDMVFRALEMDAVISNSNNE